MRTLAVFFLASLAALLPTQVVAGIVLPNLPPGSQYQLIFVTHSSHDALSPDIAVYNDFVNAESTLNPALPVTVWHAIGSTPSVNAFNNAPSGGLPVYNTAGERVDPPAGIYSGNLIAQVKYDQFGDPHPNINQDPLVWTGSQPDGSAYPGFELGTSIIRASIVGDMRSTTDTWLTRPSLDRIRDQLEEHPLYALSSPITAAVPEPGTLVVWAGLGLVTLGFVALRKKYCRA